MIGLLMRGPTVLASVALAVGPIASDSEPPEALRKLLAPTSRTAHVKWTSSQIGGRDDGLVEHHVTQQAGTNLWDNNTGDTLARHRTVYSQPEGSPDNVGLELEDLVEVPAEEVSGDRNSLLYDGRIWNHPAGPITADLAPVERANTAPWPIDPTQPNLAVRAAGDSWGRPDHFGLDSSILEGFDAAKWTTSSDGEIDTISAEFGVKRFEWRLDRSRGGLPIRAAFYAGESLRNWSETELVEIDGRWRTGRSEFYMMDATSPYRIIEVQEASFDKPWHLQEITPDDIGVVFGTRLYGARIDGEYVGFWNGAELISSQEYRKLTTLYDVMPHPSIMEGIAKLHGHTVDQQYKRRREYNAAARAKYIADYGEIPLLFERSAAEDEWDIYVREFIKEHKLTGLRKDRAYKILEQSKRLRDFHLHKYKGKIDEARRNGETEKAERFERPVGRIFEKMLKAGLNKLLRNPIRANKAP